jgi:hypothetical protein
VSHDDVQAVFSADIRYGCHSDTLAVGLNLVTAGTFFSTHRLLVVLRGFGLGYMTAGCDIWITACCECAGRPDLNPLLDLSLLIGSALLLGNLFAPKSNLTHPIALIGLLLNGGALVAGLPKDLTLIKGIGPADTDDPERGGHRHLPQLCRPHSAKCEGHSGGMQVQTGLAEPRISASNSLWSGNSL